MRNEFHIYGIVTEQEIAFIGCTKGDLPPGEIRLQTVSARPKENWVRFRRTLEQTPEKGGR